MENNQEDFLYHHGVKGMKWGVRKSESRGGLPSKRKLKKMIKKANKTPDANKHTKAVNKKVFSEAEKTTEGKAFNNLLTNMVTLEKKAKEKGGRLVYTQSQVDSINRIQKNYYSKLNSIAKKHVDQYAGAMLKDLGYKDTQAGREFLKKHKLV